MELTWLANTPQSRNRTRAPRACPACQRRKKRCRHLTLSAESTDEDVQGQGQNQGQPSRKIRAHDGDGDLERRVRVRTASADPVLPSLQSTERFVGDLNPEAVIRERLDAPTDSPLRDRVGLWIKSSTTENDNLKLGRGQGQSQGQNAVADPLPLSLLSQSTSEGQTISSILHSRYVHALQACQDLPKTTREKLTTIFINKIHPLVPLLDISDSTESQITQSKSTFLARAICLVAAKDSSATPHLILSENGPILPSRQFCSEIYKGLVTAMDSDLEPDRLTRIRVLALMSLHCEGHEGAEAASLHLCAAIHQAHTIGLHLDRPGRKAADPLARLFWCLWTLDKMHASIGGRPVMIADRDIGVPKPDSRVSENRGSFAVWLAISEVLANVISFYRPSAPVTSGWEEGFPAFEDIVEEHTNGNVDFGTLGLLELYYHCVAILSCRYKLNETIDGTRFSSIRQGLAAIRIHSIVAVECISNLPPHPIVPYAISLSMGVSYRQLRSSKLITHSNRAKASLEACCSLLEGMSELWYSAEAMARLGRKALNQMDGYRRPQQQQQLPVVREQPEQPEPENLRSLHTNTNDIPPAPGTIGLGSEIPVLPPDAGSDGLAMTLDNSIPSTSVQDLDSQVPMEGFADIDMLFGEFLDLSLPTNFWDPVFGEDEQGQGQSQ